MTARTCPTGGPCPSRTCVNHLAGRRCLLDHERVHTLAEVAAELGVAVSQAWHDEQAVIAKLGTIEVPPGISDERATEVVRGAIARGLRQQLGCNYSSSVQAGFLSVPRKFSAKPCERLNRVPLVAPAIVPSLVRHGRRAEHLFQESTMMPMTDCTTARELVAELERLPLGADTSTLVAETVARLELERAAPLALIFPSAIEPTSADALASYEHHIRRLGAHAYGDRLAELHGRAVSSHPALAALFRSTEAVDDVGQAAANLATPANPHESHAVAQARADHEARARYRLAIAASLAAAPGHPLAGAGAAVLALADLETRLPVARARHEEHARLEAQRKESERLAADRAVRERLGGVDHAVELAAALARVSPADLAERERVAAVVMLRRRLRSSKLADFRVGGRLYGTAEFALGVGECTAARCAELSAALDLAEGVERPAAVVAEQPLELPVAPTAGHGTRNATEVLHVLLTEMP